MMGGSIFIEGEYGKGSMFHMDIPYASDNAEDAETQEEDEMFVSIPDAKILVVDDNEINLYVANELLRLFDITCDTALSGAEAIERIASCKYDIVFMDHMMPNMDGVETSRILRETYDEQSLVIIALTANVIEGVREMLLSAGMNDYLSKPIDKSLLSNALYRWLPREKILTKNKPDELNTVQESGLLTYIRDNIPEIDADIALERINGMTDAIKQPLRIFERRINDIVKRLGNFLGESDLRGFAIEVHGVKGSLNNIGATGIAGLAEELEYKSKSNDVQFCAEKLPELSRSLTELKRKISAFFETETVVSKERGSLEEIIPALRDIIATLNDFEADNAMERLYALAWWDYSASVDKLLKEVIELCEAYDYENAVCKLEGLIESLLMEGMK